MMYRMFSASVGCPINGFSVTRYNAFWNKVYRVPPHRLLPSLSCEEISRSFRASFGEGRPDYLFSHAFTSLLIVTSSCPSPSSSCRQAFLRSWRSRVENARTCFVCWDDCSSLTFAITLSPFPLKHFKVMNCLRGKIRS